MDTRELEVFLLVAESLSFSRAAERAHLSLSAVSRTVQRLEDNLGRRLLERDRRRVRLTDAGCEFEAYARDAVSAWQRVRKDLKLESTALSGEVSVYCSVTASYSVLSPILERFRQEQPGIEILLHTGDQADAVDRVQAGQEDIAVAARPDRLAARLDFLTLMESELVFVAPAFECAVSSQLQDNQDQLSGVPFIMPERGVSKQRLESWFRDIGRRPRIYAQVTGHEAIASMVALGLGVGAVPRLVLENFRFMERLREIRFEVPLGPFPIGLCADRQRLENPLVSTFWESARHSYPAAK
ncbi:MAG: HTH-type transcriptional activator IlvY [Pseudomonadota bacterium]